MSQIRASKYFDIFKKDCPPCLIFYGAENAGQNEFFNSYFGNKAEPFDIKTMVKPKIDELIETRSWLMTKPAKQYKVIRLEKINEISKEAANFLLKVIEDAPSYVRWVLFTETKNIAGALKSRSFTIPFKEKVDETDYPEVREKLVAVLQSKKYCNAYEYIQYLKKNFEDNFKDMLIYSCNIMEENYQSSSRKLASIQKVKNIIKRGTREDTIFKVLMVDVL